MQNSISLDTTLHLNKNNTRSSTRSACRFNVAQLRLCEFHTRPVSFQLHIPEARRTWDNVILRHDTQLAISMKLPRFAVPDPRRSSIDLYLEMVLYEPSSSKKPGSSLVARCKIQFGQTIVSAQPLFVNLCTVLPVTSVVPLKLSAGGGSHYLVSWSGISAGADFLSISWLRYGSRRGDLD